MLFQASIYIYVCIIKYFLFLDHRSTPNLGGPGTEASLLPGLYRRGGGGGVGGPQGGPLPRSGLLPMGVVSPHLDVSFLSSVEVQLYFI